MVQSPLNVNLSKIKPNPIQEIVRIVIFIQVKKGKYEDETYRDISEHNRAKKRMSKKIEIYKS